MEIKHFVMKNKSGMEVRVIDYGGIITSIKVPDRKGILEDVVLGFDSDLDYSREHPYFGALVGRYANRIGRGRYEIEGEAYELPLNDGKNTLHGGLRGFDKMFWHVKVEGDQHLKLNYSSLDGEEGHPGNLHVNVDYRLSEDNELSIEYRAVTDKPTVINLTNHSYFNLSGKSSSILDHRLSIRARTYTEVDPQLIPTGKLINVLETPFDFRFSRAIGARIAEVDGGYDHNFVLEGRPGELKVAAVLYDPGSGRKLEVKTTEPGLQFYSGNFLDGSLMGKGGRAYHKHAGLCLETQHFPDSPNRPEFPSTLLRPGEFFHSQTSYRFSVHQEQT